MTGRYDNRARRSGFTLAEVLISAALIAVAFVALVSAFGHESVVTQRGEEITIATGLADEVRNMALQMEFSGLLDLDGTVFSPAILSTGTAQGDAAWAQTVHVTAVSATDLNAENPESGPLAARVDVSVSRSGRPVVDQAYYVFDRGDVVFVEPED